MKKTPIVFIAGAYKGTGKLATELNIVNATGNAVGVWRAGFPCICPHTNSANFEHASGLANEQIFYRGYIAILRRCDCVVMVHNWEMSQGAVAERNEAKRRGLPIFYSVYQMTEYYKTRRWTRAVADWMRRTLGRLK